MKFRVAVKKADGSEETRVIEAESRFEIYAQIEKEGSTVVTLEEGGGFQMPAWANMTIGTGIKTEKKITFTKNLSAMLQAGLPLSRALSVIERQAAHDAALKKIVTDLEMKIKGGTSFHEALADYPKVFPKLFVAMTKAGEEGGSLSDTLKIVARQMDRSYTLTKKVKGAMIYPSIILIAIVIIGILMLLFVVPTLAATFEQLGAALPISTQVILAASNFMVHHYIIVVVGLIVLVAGGATISARNREQPSYFSARFICPSLESW